VWLDVLTKITTLASAVPQWRERLAALIAALGGA
jgi:hypothetical protein